MAKYKIEFHEATGRYYIKYKGWICSHPVLGTLVAETRKKFGYGSYSMTKKARKNHG